MSTMTFFGRNMEPIGNYIGPINVTQNATNNKGVL